MSVGLTVKFSVAMESQPLAAIKLAVYVPAALIVCPFQLYGSWLLQMVVFVVLVTAGLTVNTNVAIESQPLAAVRFAV